MSITASTPMCPCAPLQKAEFARLLKAQHGTERCSRRRPTFWNGPVSHLVRASELVITGGPAKLPSLQSFRLLCVASRCDSDILCIHMSASWLAWFRNPPSFCDHPSDTAAAEADAGSAGHVVCTCDYGGIACTGLGACFWMTRSPTSSDE